MCSFLQIFLSSLNGKEGSTATSEEVGECGDNDNEWKAQSDSSECGRSLSWDAGNVNAVHDVVQ